MTDPSQPSSPASHGDTKRRPIQFNLVSILLLISACAIWAAYYSVYAETQQIKRQLPGLKRIARELHVEDSQKYAAVTQLATRFGELIWHMYVPDLPGRSASLCVAMDEIPQRTIVDQPLKAVRLPAGKHELELRYELRDVAKLTVLVDGSPTIEIERPKDWLKSTGSTSTSNVGEISRSYPVDEPLVLHRRHFSTGGKASPRESGPGILLWTELSDQQGEH